MGASQHKSPHQARAFRRGLDVVTSAEISQSRRTSHSESQQHEYENVEGSPGSPPPDPLTDKYTFVKFQPPLSVKS